MEDPDLHNSPLQGEHTVPSLVLPNGTQMFRQEKLHSIGAAKEPMVKNWKHKTLKLRFSIGS